jgi:hypothetical protein
VTDAAFRIQGLVVNHNTSHFVELMVRTLFYTNDLGGIDFMMTVLDNASDDEHLESLRAYLARQNVAFVQTGYDNAVAVEKHGAALASFVKKHGECSHYLFLDSDMWFVEENTIPTMLAELLEAPPDIFADQARIYGYYAGRVIEGREGVPGVGDVDDFPSWDMLCGDKSYVTSSMRRCSPVCSLVINAPIFRKVVETFGLGRAMGFGVGEARWYDTFSLMTHMMATHGLRFIVSSKTVNHFTETVYRPELRAPKDRDCLKMLKELREGRGMALENFRLSDWVKQNRESVRHDENDPT